MSPENSQRSGERPSAEPVPATIVQAGDPVLRRPASQCPPSMTGAALTELVARMSATLDAAGGVGLAAPQIGVALSIAILQDAASVPPEVAEARERRPLPLTVLINPRIVWCADERAEFFEGCLSVSGWQAVVSRPTAVRVEHEALDRTPRVTELTGWQARIACHEIDHLMGTLYLDRAITRSFTSQANYLHRWSDPFPHDASAQLGFATGDGPALEDTLGAPLRKRCPQGLM